MRAQERLTCIRPVACRPARTSLVTVLSRQLPIEVTEYCVMMFWPFQAVGKWTKSCYCWPDYRSKRAHLGGAAYDCGSCGLDRHDHSWTGGDTAGSPGIWWGVVE